MNERELTAVIANLSNMAATLGVLAQRPTQVINYHELVVVLKPELVEEFSDGLYAVVKKLTDVIPERPVVVGGDPTEEDPCDSHPWMNPEDYAAWLERMEARHGND